MENIRNFVIIAHIDHGKSTLADRLLEITKTIDSRKMKSQYLDQMELERERGITIKMAPVRMEFGGYVLNLIDTPGHPDFSYEVSRALAAVEGAVLLVDGTQGIQAQTLSNYYAAKKEGLKIIGAVNKIDMQSSEIEKSIKSIAGLLGVGEDKIHKISAKTGEGVKELLKSVINEIPSPQDLALSNVACQNGFSRAMIFDSFYDDHKGIIVSVRVFDGGFQLGDNIELIAVNYKTAIKEVGIFSPSIKNKPELKEGEIGYIVTGIKDTKKIKIGDTIISISSRPKISESGNSISNKIETKNLALLGYKEPKPVVFVSFFPNEESEFDDLRKALERLQLNDSAFIFEPDYNEVLGRGFKGGFLGKLHFEIVLQRLDREFNIRTTTSFPSVEYLVKTNETMPSGTRKDNNGYYHIRNANNFPYVFEDVKEPMIRVKIITPNEYLGKIMQMQDMFRFEMLSSNNIGYRILIEVRMPLAELIADFDDKIKSVSKGFASFSYEDDGYKKSNLVRLDVFVAGDQIPGLSRVVVKSGAERIARNIAKKLKEILPRQQFSQAIQIKMLNKIIARETIPALRKDVTGYLYGGDRTRKMKLWKKQKEGKKRLKSMAKVRISAEDFKKLLSK